MKRLVAVSFALLVIAFTHFGCSHLPGRADAGWITLFDGTNLDSWTRVGDANWRLADGVVQADEGIGFLVSKNSYTDFHVRVEFWVDADANSGVFLRMSDIQNITVSNAYEVNIVDKRPDMYGTGAIVNVAKVSPVPQAGGKWNTYDITAKGAHLTVTFNGIRTVDVHDSRLASGPIGLQHVAGLVKFRKVQIRPL
jgi:3-keto-disaccharide hydrolase